MGKNSIARLQFSVRAKNVPIFSTDIKYQIGRNGPPWLKRRTEPRWTSPLEYYRSETKNTRRNKKGTKRGQRTKKRVSRTVQQKIFNKDQAINGDKVIKSVLACVHFDY